MKKYIRNLEEKVSSVLNESLVSDAAKLVGIEEQDAEDRIKGLSFANYIELGNAIELEDAETVREILSTVAPIEEGKLAKAAAIGTMALGLGAAAADQGTHSTSADDPSWDGPHDVQMSTQRSIDQDDNLTDRSLSVKGPNADGEYLVTYLDGDEIKRYVTKTPPKDMKPKQLGKTIAKESNDLLDKPTMSVREIADKHDVPVAEIASQLAIGIKIELEHTNNRKVAKEIALDHLMELPDYYDRLAKMEETASAGGTGAGAVGGGDIGTWDGKAHKKPKKGLKNSGKGIYEDGSGELYHVTHTKYVPNIQKNGIRPMGADSNWVQQGSGERYGMGEVYVFTNREDAKKWAGRMDWDFNQTLGSGNISIITLRKPADHDFERDEADPMSQAGQQGEWLKTYEPISPENIVSVDAYDPKMESVNEDDTECDLKLLDQPTMTVREIADKHDVPMADIASQLAMGIKVELEHTKDRKIAKEIALDHLMELPDYYSKLDKMENEKLDEIGAAIAGAGRALGAAGKAVGKAVGSAAKAVGSAAKNAATQVATAAATAQATQAAGEEGQNAMTQYKNIDDLSVGDDIEVIDIDGDPAAVTVKTPRGPGDTLVVQTDKGEEHIVKKQAVSGTPTIQEMYESALETYEGRDPWLPDTPIPDKFYSKKTGKLIKSKAYYDWIESQKKVNEEELSYESALTDRVHEAYNANKTEHSGAKKGKGGYHGRKQDAKRDSNKKRRADDKKAISEVAPPGMEDWIKKRKPEFKKRYGDDWESVLYATAWKRHNNESIEENKDEFKKKLVHGDRYFIRREYHIGKKPYDDFEAQVLAVSDTEDTWSGFKHKVRFKDNKGEEIVAWYPEPGKGGLSGRFYDEQLVKAGGKGKYVAGDSRNEWPAVGVEEAFDPATHVNVEHRDPEGRFIIVHVPPAGYWAVGKGQYQHDIDRTSFDNFDDALDHAEQCLASLDEKFDHYGSDARFIPVEFMGEEVGVVWQEGEGDWHAEVSATGASWGMIDSYKDAVQLVQDEAAEYMEESFDLSKIRRLAGLKETASAGATGAGAIATAPAAMGGMVKRSPSIYDKPKPKKRTKESNDGSIGRLKKK